MIAVQYMAPEMPKILFPLLSFGPGEKRFGALPALKLEKSGDKCRGF